jgi:hypothetical protein
MKNILLIVLSVFLVSCSDDGIETNNEITVDSIYGVWEVSLVYNENHDGINDEWIVIPERSLELYNHRIIIRENGTFSNSLRTCTEGTFSIDQDILNFQYENCIDWQGSTLLTENFYFEDNYLVLIPQYLGCIHGCGFKYRKISSEQ